MKNQIISIIVGLVIGGLCVYTILNNKSTRDDIRGMRAEIKTLTEILQEIRTKPAETLPGENFGSITNTSESNPVVTVYGSDSQIWDDQVPHDVEDVARFLDVTPDTIRDQYIDKWRAEGIEINKNSSNRWEFPEGFKPYKP